MNNERPAELPLAHAFAWAAAAVVCFHLAQEFDSLRGFIIGFLFCLVPLARLNSARKAVYLGLAIGFAIYAPQLEFFWTIFQATAIALWAVLAFWLALFTLLSRQALRHFGRKGLLVIPILWLGLEVFRSELYYLRFSWLTPGFVFSGSRLAEALGFLGVYGIGAILFAVAVSVWAMPRMPRLAALGAAVGVCSLLGTTPNQSTTSAASPSSRVEVAGVQLEFPTEEEVLVALNKLAAVRTNASLFVLSEYTFKNPIPDRVKAWCRENKKFLVVGGEDPSGDNYFNTAFVIGPDGDIVFKQAKSVPIQFFQDGLPAREQQLWNSPWGKIGMGVCYDLSYRRVFDWLAAQGCQALIVPTMDVANWGERQHRLHARVAPMRAAEYGVPIFRLCSSGISQAIEGDGRVTGVAPCFGEGAVLSATLALGKPGRVPLDHWLGPGATGITAILILLFLIPNRSSRIRTN